MLKKCPFCGKVPTVHCWQSLIKDHFYYSVECKNKQCSIQPITREEYTTRTGAVIAWNARA